MENTTNGIISTTLRTFYVDHNVITLTFLFFHISKSIYSDPQNVSFVFEPAEPLGHPHSPPPLFMTSHRCHKDWLSRRADIILKSSPGKNNLSVGSCFVLDFIFWWNLKSGHWLEFLTPFKRSAWMLNLDLSENNTFKSCRLSVHVICKFKPSCPSLWAG